MASSPDSDTPPRAAIPLHQAANRLLRAVRASGPIDRLDFEDLVASNARMRANVDAVRSAINAALGNRDALTSAYGRVDMLPTLEALLALTRDDGMPCSLVFVDVDNRKPINGQHGHPQGDQVLAGLVRHLDAHLRPRDKVFRYGGREFLLALPGADIPVALYRSGSSQPLSGGRAVLAQSGRRTPGHRSSHHAATHPASHAVRSAICCAM